MSDRTVGRLSHRLLGLLLGLLLLTGSVLAGCGESTGPTGGGGTSPPPAPPPPPPPAPPPLGLTAVGKIVFVRSGQLVMLNADGTGEIVPLGVSGFLHDVSPDGSKIAYTSTEDVAVLDLGTGSVTLLATQGRNVAPRWSPDGERILFWSDRTGVQQVWVMNADGSSQTRLTQGGGLEGDWSPDGTRIVFRGADNNLWVMNADGTNPVELFAGEGQDAAPRWSPDGTRIAFDGVRGVNVDIFVIDADGTNLVSVTSHAAADWNPSWSPDGTRIAFFSHPGASGEVRQGQSARGSDIYTVSPEGSEADLTLFLGGPRNDLGPVYGPPQ